MSLLILNAEPEGYSEEARSVLRGLGELVEEHVPQERLSERVREFDILIVRLGLRVTREVMEASDRLKVIVTATTGLDHIDLQAAGKRGVAVLSLSGEHELLRTVPATAEHTWALLLALVRMVPWAFDGVCRGNWDRDCFRGEDLRGKSLAILGLGRVGEQVATFGLAFGMVVGAYDPHREGWVEGVRCFTTLDALLRWAEVLTVHVPLNSETLGFLDREHLSLLRRGAWVVNSSRGAIVDEIALIELLKGGHLAGAALDVIHDETDIEARRRSPLLAYAKKHTNLLITPHLGGATVESMARTEVFMARKLQRYLSQGSLQVRLTGWCE